MLRFIWLHQIHAKTEKKKIVVTASVNYEKSRGDPESVPMNDPGLRDARVLVEGTHNLGN